MLHHSGLPKFLWGEAILHAVWLKNRTSTRALKNLTPFEALTGKKPDLSNLPEWGMKVWVHDDGNSKLEGRSKIGRWVGFDVDSTHAHRIYWPEKQTVSVERNIKFNETEVYIPSSDTPLEGENDSDSDNQESVNRPVETPSPSYTPVDASTLLPKPEVTAPIPDPIPRCSQRIGNTYKDGFPNYAMLGEIEEEEYEIGGAESAMGAATVQAEGLEPRTIEEAKKQVDCYARRIPGMLLSTHLARISLAASGSSRSRRTPRGELPSTRRG